MNNEINLVEEKISSQEIYHGKILDLYCDTVRLPNGEDGKREYIRHIGAACVVPITKEGEVLLVKQYRYPFASVLAEIPAGKLDAVDEDPLHAAQRELWEETGATADEMIYLGAMYPTVAYSTEAIHMYLAYNVTPGKQHLDDDEFLLYETVPLDTFVQQIMRGEIRDSKTQLAVLKAYYYLKERNGN